MRERLEYLVVYVGSAAVAAFIAACIEAPSVATFTCDTPPGGSEERCAPAQTVEASPAARTPDGLAIALAALN
jgi:hypothetical protein